MVIGLSSVSSIADAPTVERDAEESIRKEDLERYHSADTSFLGDLFVHCGSGKSVLK